MIKVFETFAGIGTQRMALKNLGIEHEVVAISEIDKYAIKSYEEIHGKTKNLGDITKLYIDDIPDHDLFTYSFPCQDISVAGKQAGFSKNSGTRSGLLWECEKVIEVKRPKYLLMENVKNLVGKKFKADFEKWLERLEELGYTNYWQVLNAKDYGIPQNRERVYCVSILGEHTPYEFPKGFELKLRLKDILEDEVEEKFYLSKEQVDRIKFSTYNQNNRRLQEKDYSDTLCARDYKDPKVVRVNQIGQYDTPTRENSSRYRVYDDKSLSPSLTTMGGGNLEPHIIDNPVVKRLGGIFDKENQTHISVLQNKETPSVQVEDFRYDEGLRIRKNGLSPCLTTQIGSSSLSRKILLIKNGTKKGYLEATEGDGIDLGYPESQTRRGRVQSQMIQTLDTSDNKGVVENFRGRKLTPKECWRLMGISDEDFYKAQRVNSNTQLYKQAGNAIVVDVLKAIFYNLFK